MYRVEIKPGLWVSCEKPEEAIVLAEILVDARKEQERRERWEWRQSKQR